MTTRQESKRRKSPRMKRYLVTRTETVVIEARSEAEAEFIGEQQIEYFGSDTEAVQVEVIEED